MKTIYEYIDDLLAGNASPVIFEIGANTGSDTVKLASIPGSVVHAFEPEPRCNLSGMPANVKVNRVAVSDSTGEAIFNLSDSPGHVWTYSSSLLRPKNHLTAHKHVHFEKQVKVKTITLDEYCMENGVDSIDFVWMDVQGAEEKVFMGGSSILQKTKYIYTEYSDDEMYEGQAPLKKLLDMLGTFEVVAVWPREPSNVLLKNNQYKENMIIRIDDFPTGVRPVLPDISMFFRILDVFEENCVTFHLGIVPDVLQNCVNDADKAKLKKYKYLVPVQHGYDHRYYEKSSFLVKAGDPFNRKTLGVFNEFENVDPVVVTQRVMKGKLLLESFFGRKVDHYIPVCNHIDAVLLNALRNNRFSRVFTMPYNQQKVAGIRQVLTGYSGKLSAWDGMPVGCLGLHITWEYDYMQEYGWDAWIKQFNGKILGRTTVAVQPDETITPRKDAPSIPHVANFYWNTETPMSLLRFLTLKSFRHHHPDWIMNLWTSGSNTGNVWKGNTEQQDFQSKPTGRNYMADVPGLKVNILQFNYSIAKELAPNYISDIARFRTIEEGGWFFDLDQIFLRNFDDLCNYDFVAGRGGDGSMYCGVLGASPFSGIPALVNRLQVARLARSTSLPVYGELGNVFLHKLSKSDEWGNASEGERHLITGFEYFYPVNNSGDVPLIYEGKIAVPATENNYALHWYGGHPRSQEFNAKYTAAFAKRSNDAVSVYCRSTGLI